MDSLGMRLTISEQEVCQVRIDQDDDGEDKLSFTIYESFEALPRHKQIFLLESHLQSLVTDFRLHKDPRHLKANSLGNHETGQYTELGEKQLSLLIWITKVLLGQVRGLSLADSSEEASAFLAKIEKDAARPEEQDIVSDGELTNGRPIG